MNTAPPRPVAAPAARSHLLRLYLVLASIAGACASKKAIVRQTDFERGSLFELERVTHEDQSAEDIASISADTLAYDTDKDGQWEIYVKPIIGREVTRKTTTQAMDTSPTLSGDGTQIAFTSNREGPTNIYVMNARQASSVLKVGEGTAPKFSSDGKALFYQRYLPGEGASSIWKYDFQTSQHSQLVNGFHPAPSHAGTHLAYCKPNSSSGYGALWVVDLATGSESQVTSVENASTVLPCWSPDDRHLLFTINRGAVGRTRVPAKMQAFTNCDLAVVEASGTNQTILTDNPTNDIGRGWGADGHIYFSSFREKSLDIWRFKPRLLVR